MVKVTIELIARVVKAAKLRKVTIHDGYISINQVPQRRAVFITGQTTKISDEVMDIFDLTGINVLALHEPTPYHDKVTFDVHERFTRDAVQIASWLRCHMRELGIDKFDTRLYDVTNEYRDELSQLGEDLIKLNVEKVILGRTRSPLRSGLYVELTSASETNRIVIDDMKKSTRNHNYTNAASNLIDAIRISDSQYLNLTMSDFASVKNQYDFRMSTAIRAFIALKELSISEIMISEGSMLIKINGVEQMQKFS